MATEDTGTTQKDQGKDVKKEDEVKKDGSTEQGTAGDTSTPSKKEGEKDAGTQESDQKKDEDGQATLPSKEESQKRIDKMYARLQGERRKRVEAENKLKIKEATSASGDGNVEEDEEDDKPKVTGLSEGDVNNILDSRERSSELRKSETRVLLRHPTALNEDGNFNMEDPFTKKYMEIGRRNPQLAAMENGPELAEAMVEKELGIGFKQGAQTEADRSSRADNSHTGSSTTTKPTGDEKPLSNEQKRVAKRMHMTDDEYRKNMVRQPV